MKRAGIYMGDIFCGVLTEDESGYHFQYDEQYLKSDSAKPLSPTMPLQSEEYTKEMMFPVFDGLIPEGWMLDIVHKNWKIDPRDRMSLLLTCCRDCIGNISVKEYER
jgi:serine/threonine-protein kinase HipA